MAFCSFEGFPFSSLFLIGILKFLKIYYWWSQDGRGIGWGGHFLSWDQIQKRSFECCTTSTKQFLNADRGHQAPRKAAQSLWMEVEQNKKDENRDKRFRERAILQRESWRRRSFHSIGSPLTSVILGSFGISEGNRTENTHIHTHTRNTFLTTTTSGKAAQTLPSINNDSGLGKEVCAASLFFRVRTGLNALKAIWGG